MIGHAIYHKPDLNLAGMCRLRNAVRAVIMRGDRIISLFNPREETAILSPHILATEVRPPTL